MYQYGYIRVASASPQLRVADCVFNTLQTILLLEQCESSGVDVVVFPELGITSYTCHDLFHDQTLISDALNSLANLVTTSRDNYSGLLLIGLPIQADGRLFNAAVAIQRGKVLGVIPKSFLPTYKEFYDSRYFAPASAMVTTQLSLLGQHVPFGPDLLFQAIGYSSAVVGVEICEDLWTPIPPSCYQSLAGATVLTNLSASPETIGKASYRKQLVTNQSGRCLAAYIYASSGPGESTTDVVYGGHCIIADNATLLVESKRLCAESQLIITDIDIDHLIHERISTNSFHGGSSQQLQIPSYRRIPFSLRVAHSPQQLRRVIDGHPFVPRDSPVLDERCEEIFQIQVRALAQRLEHVGTPTVAIGVSGGLDSTLALLVVCKTFDILGLPRSNVNALTMPGFGTTPRTKSNAQVLMDELGVSSREVDIRPLCLQQMLSMAHKPFGIDLTGLDVESLSSVLSELPDDRRHDLIFENIQARIRTSLLMTTGFVIGTGDLSELALGWCTYNADHMSMYNVNVSIPKTLVKFLVQWVANHEFVGTTRHTLLDIVDTEISPELLPTRSNGQSAQSTEAIIGPYELHDFFLYYFLRHGTPPEKILYLAQQATFDRQYAPDELKHWLKIFLKRFFNNQFKRSCLPDGPKVGSVSLSPRGDWRMPSDAVVKSWLANLDQAGSETGPTR